MYTSHLLFNEPLDIRRVKQDALAKLLRWFAVADRTEVENLKDAVSYLSSGGRIKDEITST